MWSTLNEVVRLPQEELVEFAHVQMSSDSNKLLCFIGGKRNILDVLAEPLKRALEKMTPSKGVVSRNAVIFDALDQLTEQGTLASAGNSSAVFTLPTFLVRKSDGVTSRLIIDCREVNEILTSAVSIPKMPLPYVQDLLNMGLAYNFIAVAN